MPLEVPQLDQRDYADILRDALARIPVHNPEWTNFNDSDPGVTMIQLFAFMTESILYRANQIPERNRLKFLKLLGIPLRPAAPARGFITINNERGPLEVKTFGAGVDVRAGQVRFLTTRGLDVLPLEARIFYKQELSQPANEKEQARNELYTQLYADLLDDNDAVPKFYETVPTPQPEVDGTLPVVDLATTIDGCLWIALLARKGDDLDAVRDTIANKTLTIGVMPHHGDEGIAVKAGEVSRSETQIPVHWEIASVPANNAASYALLPARAEGSILNEAGLVELTLPAADQLTTWDWSELEPGLEGTGEYPPSLADTNIADRVVTWIRLRVDKDPTVRTTLSWLGINATMVEQRVTVTGEIVGTGTGEPDQCLTLANVPVLPESLVLTVDGEVWSQVDDLLAADPEVPVGVPRQPLYQSEAAIAGGAQPRTKVYTLDPEAGTICFGDGAHGMRPRPGARIVASYAFGGGKQGNLGIGAINKSPQLPASYKVSNPLLTWGGGDAETVASAEKTIPRTVQHRDRLVSVQDFKDITLRTPGVDLGRVEVLPLYDPASETVSQVPGVVTVMVIPASPALNTPKPDQFFLETVCDHLLPRRLITTELYVRGPNYVDVWISVGITVLGGYATGPVREAAERELLRFLSPLYGGHKGLGWPLDVSVTPSELEAVVARVDGVRAVNSLLLGSATANNVTSVPIAGLQLPRLVGVRVVDGNAIPLNQLKSAPPATDNLPEGQRWTGIPVLPERC
ncbi:MAG TPA: putative baseplate assembly protein [Spirillospora sp.]|nr:putative baseplate assembly protein [Spirillospora sp.]